MIGFAYRVDLPEHDSLLLEMTLWTSMESNPAHEAHEGVK